MVHSHDTPDDTIDLLTRRTDVIRFNIIYASYASF